MSASPEARSQSALTNGNQMATIFAPTRVIPGCSGTRVEEYRMGSILVRGLDQKTIERLKERARLNGRSLQQEVKALLERAAETLTMREARRVSERWRRPARWTVASPTARRLIREDRDSSSGPRAGRGEEAGGGHAEVLELGGAHLGLDLLHVEHGAMEQLEVLQDRMSAPGRASM